MTQAYIVDEIPKKYKELDKDITKAIDGAFEAIINYDVNPKLQFSLEILTELLQDEDPEKVRESFEKYKEEMESIKREIADRLFEKDPSELTLAELQDPRYSTALGDGVRKYLADSDDPLLFMIVDIAGQMEERRSAGLVSGTVATVLIGISIYETVDAISTASDLVIAWEEASARGVPFSEFYDQHESEFFDLGLHLVTSAPGLAIVGKGAQLLKRLAKCGKVCDVMIDKAGEVYNSALEIGLKGKTELEHTIRYFRHVMNSEVGAVGDIQKLLIQTGGKNLKAYSFAMDELVESGIRISKEADEFISRQIRNREAILGARGSFTKEDLIRVAAQYDDLAFRMDDIIPTTYVGKVWRAVPEEYVDDIYSFTEHSLKQNHRYSMPGDGALYTSVGNDARETIMAELRKNNLNGYAFKSKDYVFDKVLDLTDSRTRKALGVTEDMLKNTKRLNNYEVTHQIGKIAKEKGFNAIRAPSARNKGGVNMIILGD